MNKREKARLYKIICDARAKLDEAESAERDKINARLIGRCFRYQNSYGGDKEKWWLYMRVTRVDDGSLRAMRFEEDCYGRVNVDPNAWIMHGEISYGWKPISRSDFDMAWIDIIAKLGDL
jgi:hypothetical protein